jgi:alkylation response protein AidB-like acyl-CoA dehydrogenase
VLLDLARTNGKVTEPSVRQDLARLHTLNELGRFNNVRAKAAQTSGIASRAIPGGPNLAKLSMSEIVRQLRDVGLRILGPLGTLHAYNVEDNEVLEEATDNPFRAAITELSLIAPGPSIYGGTDQVQRNIVGERVLGLPKEPNNDKVVPFKDLPKNA